MREFTRNSGLKNIQHIASQHLVLILLHHHKEGRVDYCHVPVIICSMIRRGGRRVAVEVPVFVACACLSPGLIAIKIINRNAVEMQVERHNVVESKMLLWH